MLKTWVNIHSPNSPHVHGLQCAWHSCLQKYHDVHVYFLFLMIQSIIIHYIPASTHSHRQFIMYRTARVNFLKHAANHVTALHNASSWLPISIKVRIFSVPYVSKLVYHVYRPRNLPLFLSPQKDKWILTSNPWPTGTVFPLFAWLIHLINKDSTQKSPPLHRDNVYDYRFKTFSPHINITICHIPCLLFWVKLSNNDINLLIY